MNEDNLRSWLADPSSHANPALIIGERTLVDDLLKIHRDGPLCCRRVRGDLCGASDSFLREVSAALQVPWLGNYNWDALDDDLQDLSWISGGLIIAFTDADLLFQEEMVRWTTLLSILLEATNAWQVGHPLEEGGTGATRFFGAAFQCRPAGKELVQRMTTSSGYAPVITLTGESNPDV